MIGKTVGLAVASFLCVATPFAEAAGLAIIDVPAGSAGPALHGAVWYPCAATPGEVKLGPSELLAVKDCPLVGENLPLVVVSHGLGGSFVGHHDTAEALADAGFVVAAINHPGDSGRSDTRHPDDLSSLTDRPADIERLTDFMLGAWPNASKIDSRRVGFFGFSRGGFTGLVAIGGDPDFRRMLGRCEEEPGNPMCEDIRKDWLRARSLPHDPRIKAAVLADPLFGPVFLPDDLRNVTVPVQLWGSEYGGDGVLPGEVAAIARALPSKLDYRPVPNAGHFAFLAPCSPEQAKAARPEICTDAAGFDRVAFHKQLDADAVAFFRTNLGEASRP